MTTPLSIPTRANGQPAFGAYLRAPTGTRHGTGLYVLTLTGDRICAMIRFDNSVLGFEGDGVHGIVVPAHRVEVGVRPDRLGDPRLGAHAVPTSEHY